MLREDLAADADLLVQVFSITAEIHANSAPSICLEEELNYLALRHGDDAGEKINDALRPALRVLKDGGDPAREIAKWASGALPRLHPRVRTCPNAYALMLGSAASLGRLGRRRLIDETPDVNTSMGNVAWILSAESLAEPVDLGVELVERGVRFLDPTETDSTLSLPGTEPLFVGISWERSGEEVEMLVEAEVGRTVDLGDDVEAVTIRTLAGEEYRLEELRVLSTASGSFDITGTAANTEHHPADGVEPDRGAETALDFVCYVIMGFGGVDSSTGVERSPNEIYQDRIRPAAERAGFACRRWDTSESAGALQHAEYAQLRLADAVVVDISAATPQVMYQLGVVHALRERGVLVIADADAGFEKMIHGLEVMQYPPSESTETKELENFWNVFTEILQMRASPTTESPIYAFGEQFRPPTLDATAPEPSSEPGLEGSPGWLVLGHFDAEPSSPEQGRAQDFSQIYKFIIKPVALEMGLELIRQDHPKVQPIDARTFGLAGRSDVVVVRLRRLGGPRAEGVDRCLPAAARRPRPGRQPGVRGVARPPIAFQRARRFVRRAVAVAQARERGSQRAQRRLVAGISAPLRGSLEKPPAPSFLPAKVRCRIRGRRWSYR